MRRKYRRIIAAFMMVVMLMMNLTACGRAITTGQDADEGQANERQEEQLKDITSPGIVVKYRDAVSKKILSQNTIEYVGGDAEDISIEHPEIQGYTVISNQPETVKENAEIAQEVIVDYVKKTYEHFDNQVHRFR